MTTGLGAVVVVVGGGAVVVVVDEVGGTVVVVELAVVVDRDAAEPRRAGRSWAPQAPNTSMHPASASTGATTGMNLRPTCRGRLRAGADTRWQNLGNRG
jgi:hypothetical protein